MTSQRVRSFAADWNRRSPRPTPVEFAREVLHRDVVKYEEAVQQRRVINRPARGKGRDAVKAEPGEIKPIDKKPAAPFVAAAGAF